MKNEIMQTRRTQLRKWIDDHYEDPFKQAQFIRDLEKRNPDVNINQGEIASLLKDKIFGEKKARRIEFLAGMPDGHLDLISNHPLDNYKVAYDRASKDQQILIIGLLDTIKMGQANDDESFKGAETR